MAKTTETYKEVCEMFGEMDDTDKACQACVSEEPEMAKMCGIATEAAEPKEAVEAPEAAEDAPGSAEPADTAADSPAAETAAQGDQQHAGEDKPMKSHEALAQALLDSSEWLGHKEIAERAAKLRDGKMPSPVSSCLSFAVALGALEKKGHKYRVAR